LFRCGGACFTSNIRRHTTLKGDQKFSFQSDIISTCMATTEHTINDTLAGILRETRSVWRASDVVSSENTSMLKGSNARPDILVMEPTVSPVVIETEVLPAITVEAEAVARLGEQVRTTGRTILSSIAVRLPVRLRKKTGTALQRELARADDLEMALYTGINPTEASRWPHSGWLPGTAADLSILAQSASVPPEVIKEAANQLVSGVSEAAGLLADMAKAHSGAIHKISEELRQEDSEQTRRMATTILANAFVFQETLAGGPGKLASVKSLDELRGMKGGISKSVVLDEWRKILKVNYWPIFDIARRILEVIPAPDSKVVIERMAETADKLLENRLMRSHDLTGAVFQQLIADRKFLAAYYTTPASASLLAGLAVTREGTPAGGDWGNANDVKALRIVDFACGTGTLLSTAYQRIGQFHELAGGNAEALHSEMMAHSLIGCDVMPAAAHLTASMVSGAHPTVTYKQSSIMTVAYGKQPDGAIALGSLDLLDPQARGFGILDITARVMEGMGEAEKETWSHLPHASFDIVIMNPPFTRATGHEGKKIGVPVPMFAAFASTEEEQYLMSKATQRLTKGTSAHGNAGEASIFLVLADRKLKQGGVLALVMPLSLMSGVAWEASRALLAKCYSGLILASIAAADDDQMSFSADTGMGECLVVGQKDQEGSKRATFIVLKERPAFPLLGASAASQVHRLIASKQLRRLEDGPVGGTPLHFGAQVIGHAMDAPLPTSGGWNLARIADLALAQSAYQITNKNRVLLPAMNKSDAVGIPITVVGTIGKIGPYHSDIEGSTATGGIRGPFTVSEVQAGSAPTYPVLWSHDAVRERTILFDADCEGQPRQTTSQEEREIVDVKAASIWATASHLHFNENFRFNSQSTAMQFTPRRSLGGRAWTSISLPTADQEKVMALWGNTSVGLLVHWWHANKEQSGRGNVTITALETLPVLDVTTLKRKQLANAVKLFDEISLRPLLPFHELDKDPGRTELDKKFLGDVLGWPASFFKSGGPLEVLRMKLALEPSIRGGK
jgi:hypothetical protein